MVDCSRYGRNLLKSFSKQYAKSMEKNQLPYQYKINMLDEMAGLRESSKRLFLSNKVDAVYFIRRAEKNEGWAYLAQPLSLTKILKNWTGSGNVQRVRGAELEESSSVPGNTRMYLVFRFLITHKAQLILYGIGIIC